MSEVLVGGVERVWLTFADITGAPVDPSVISVDVWEPDGSKTTYTLAGGGVKNDASAVGLFYLDHPIDQRGIHTAIGTSTSPQAAAIAQFVAVA